MSVVQVAAIAHMRQRVPVRRRLGPHDRRRPRWSRSSRGLRTSGVFRWVSVRRGLIRPGMMPAWIPFLSDISSPREKARPDRTHEAARRRTSSSTRLSVPSWSSRPQRPQLRTLAATSENRWRRAHATPGRTTWPGRLPVNTSLPFTIGTPFTIVHATPCGRAE